MDRSEIVFALGIPNTPWIQERAESLERLKLQLVQRPVYYREFKEKEPNWSWSEKLWQWAIASPGTTHLLQLQDDVIVGPEFWPALRSMVSFLPNNIIGLESVFSPGGNWYTSSDGLIGVGYVFPIPLLKEFMQWRSALRPGAAQRLNEDQAIGLFTFDRGYKIWHPVPTIIDHDIDLESTYGNDSHSHRRPSMSTVRGDKAPDSWEPAYPMYHVRKFYQSTPFLLRRSVTGYSYSRYLEDCK